MSEELRSNIAEEEGGRVEELGAQIRELRQKLAMAEQAVNDKEEELKDLHQALERAKEESRIDLEREKQAWIEADRASKRKIAELEEQVTDLGGYANECKEEMAKQEMKAEMARLRSVEFLREKFDCERDMYLERIKRLERSLSDEASRKDPTASSEKLAEAKRDAPLKPLVGELVHKKKKEGEVASESTSTSVPVTEGGLSEKPSSRYASGPMIIKYGSSHVATFHRIIISPRTSSIF